MNCHKHKSYQGILKPKVPCFDCWLFWLEKHPDSDIKSIELLKILISFKTQVFDNINNATWQVRKDLDPLLAD